MRHDLSNTVIPDQIWTVEELERFRGSIIEECAQVLESAFAECSTLNLLHGAARIRILKEKL